MSNMTTIEVNGVKMEIDMRYAKRVEILGIGSKVRLLAKKNQYGSAGTDVYSGVIVGFEPFKDLPTIVVAYLKSDWNSASIEFAFINEKQETFDLIASVDDDLLINKADTLKRFDAEIGRKQREIEEIERRRDYFLSHFGRYFERETADDSALR